MDAAGLSQSAVAEALGVSREAVSQWLRAQSFPRPNKLLQLGRLLGLSFSELVRVEDPAAPRVAFRKMKGTKTQDHHIEKAQHIDRHLRHLVPYLPFDTLKMPPVLKAPSCDDAYLQQVTPEVRAEIGLDATPISVGSCFRVRPWMRPVGQMRMSMLSGPRRSFKHRSSMCSGAM